MSEDILPLGNRLVRWEPGQPPKEQEPHVNVGQLWAGGIATALVAGAAALLGLLVARGLLHIPVYLPAKSSTVMDATAAWLAVLAAMSALFATGMLHILLVTTPRPDAFFSWFVALATAVAALWPFSTAASLPCKISSAIIATIIGAAIGSLLSGVRPSAVRCSRAHWER
jgi:hypothetical protein